MRNRIPCALALPNARLPDNWPVVDPRAPPTAGHDRADEAERINITDAGSDDPSGPQEFEDRISRRVDFPIVRANDALALHSVVTRATERRIVKGPVIVLTATPYA